MEHKHIRLALHPSIDGFAVVSIAEQTHRGDTFGDNGNCFTVGGTKLCSTEYPESAPDRNAYWLRGSRVERDHDKFRLTDDQEAELVRACRCYNQYFEGDQPAPNVIADDKRVSTQAAGKLFERSVADVETYCTATACMTGNDRVARVKCEADRGEWPRFTIPTANDSLVAFFEYVSEARVLVHWRDGSAPAVLDADDVERAPSTLIELSRALAAGVEREISAAEAALLRDLYCKAAADKPSKPDPWPRFTVPAQDGCYMYNAVRLFEYPSNDKVILHSSTGWHSHAIPCARGHSFDGTRMPYRALGVILSMTLPLPATKLR